MIDEKKLIESSTWYPNILFKEELTWKDGWNNCNRDWMKRIDELPKVILPDTTITGWIPCSERKPNNDEYDWVLAQVQEDDGFLWIPRVMEYRESKDDWYLEDENPCWLKECHGDAFKVIAWQPLPEPYKESED